MKKHIANIITSCRILFSICLLFCPVFSVSFYIFYLFCGITDMVDGTIARKTGAVSGFGAKLDTTSDFIFFAVSLIKLFHVIHIPKLIWVWIAIIAIIKLPNIVWGFVRKKKFETLHTVLSKATGLLLFFLPFTLHIVEQAYSFTVVCAVATASAVQESYYVTRTNDEL